MTERIGNGDDDSGEASNSPKKSSRSIALVLLSICAVGAIFGVQNANNVSIPKTTNPDVQLVALTVDASTPPPPTTDPAAEPAALAAVDGPFEYRLKRSFEHVPLSQLHHKKKEAAMKIIGGLYSLELNAQAARLRALRAIRANAQLSVNSSF